MFVKKSSLRHFQFIIHTVFYRLINHIPRLLTYKKEKRWGLWGKSRWRLNFMALGRCKTGCFNMSNQEVGCVWMCTRTDWELVSTLHFQLFLSLQNVFPVMQWWKLNTITNPWLFHFETLFTTLFYSIISPTRMPKWFKPFNAPRHYHFCSLEYPIF